MAKRKMVQVSNIRVGDSLKNIRTGKWSEVAEIDDFSDWGHLIFKDKDGKRISRRLKYGEILKSSHQTKAELKLSAQKEVKAETDDQQPKPIAEQRKIRNESPAKVAKLPDDTLLADVDLKSGQQIVINYGDGAFLAINSDGLLALGGENRITQMMEIHRPTAKNRPWVISAWNDKTPVTD